MRRLLASLTPEQGQIYWPWVGGMFAFYVALMVTAAGVVVSHESPRKLARQPVTTVAEQHPASAPTPLRHAARY